ncbi:MAG TPA: LysM peptidoglycan-binding domain-containing protein [Burkholderiaceae bacterium]|nr:LysM peptidoglycan-binding domain-containing protein [Burkholderiaceae bacterium]
MVSKAFNAKKTTSTPHTQRLVHGALAVWASVALAGAASAQTTLDGRWPVTAEQRQTAEAVAAKGVPLAALAPNAPDRYTVKQGDTLWDVSSIFLTSPWRWPELWGMNKAQVRNPHLIYPGQTLVLVKGPDGMARLEVSDGDVDALPGAPGDQVKLSPRVRELDAREMAAIRSIPNNLIEPFLSQPLVVAADELDQYPRVVATQEGHVNIGRNEIAYVRGITNEQVENYHLFRAARPLYDPDDVKRAKPIAYEAFYLGSGRIVRPGEVATLRVLDSKQEIGVGDRLIPVERKQLASYVPRQPERTIDGRIVSIYGGVTQAGGQSIVTLNRGARDGVEVGHVLALLATGPTIQDRTAKRRDEFVKLPDERIGEMFVFRVFDRIAYALVMRLERAVEVGDRFTSPEDALSAEARPDVQTLPDVRPRVTEGGN